MSQVNFFMLASDEQAFFHALRARGDTLVHSGRFFDTREPPVLSALPELDSDQPYLTLVLADLAPAYPPQLLEEGPFQGKYKLHSPASPHIEWQRSVPRPDFLVSGRVYAKVGWLRSPEQNKAFRSWYSSIERWLKGRLHRVHAVWWIAHDAEVWSQQGGVLAFGDERAKIQTLKVAAT